MQKVDLTLLCEKARLCAKNVSMLRSTYIEIQKLCTHLIDLLTEEVLAQSLAGSLYPSPESGFSLMFANTNDQLSSAQGVMSVISHGSEDKRMFYVGPLVKGQMQGIGLMIFEELDPQGKEPSVCILGELRGGIFQKAVIIAIDKVAAIGFCEKISIIGEALTSYEILVLQDPTFLRKIPGRAAEDQRVCLMEKLGSLF